MSEYIDKEAFISEQRKRYCQNCERRKGTKNGKQCFVYEIGDAVCRACDIGDMISAVEDFPVAHYNRIRRSEYMTALLTAMPHTYDYTAIRLNGNMTPADIAYEAARNTYRKCQYAILGIKENREDDD